MRPHAEEMRRNEARGELEATNGVRCSAVCTISGIPIGSRKLPARRRLTEAAVIEEPGGPIPRRGERGRAGNEDMGLDAC